MRFHGMMLLRDERDVIVQNLTHLLSWIDAIYILDLGSTDGTWDVVQDFAARDKRVVPIRRAPIVYTDNLRSMIFDQYRNRFDPGDWIMKIDADEFYHVSPPIFVAERLKWMETAVWLQWYFFRLTQTEVNDYESGRVDLGLDRERPIEERRRYYKISDYAEPRMFRYRRQIQWPENSSVPYNAGFVSRERIPVRHYPHRDPMQMQRRFGLRARMMELRAHAGGHWKLNDWRAEVVDASGMSESLRRGDRGLASQAGIDTGELHYWEPGTTLVERPLYNHVARPVRRAMERLIHPLLLPVLDSTRRIYDRSYQPEAIPQAVQRSLEQAV